MILTWAWHYLTFGRGARLILETSAEARLRARSGAAPPDLETPPAPAR
ncbi:MAG: hypothetical protein QM704_08665 [Anaeromyxobacteraceae bacterium]